VRLVFLGSPPFAVPVLARVLASGRHEVRALVTRPDKPQGRGRKVEGSPLVALARADGVRVLQPTTTKDPAFVAELRALAPDALLVASYGEILREDVLGIARHGALNVHGSLLPRWRGAAPVQAAILAGDAETGVCVQRMVLALDEGDVLEGVTRRTPIGPRETAGELFDRLAELGGEAAVAALDALEGGTARFVPQDASQASYARKIAKEHGRIDWTRSAEELERFVRAMTPWPGARTSASGGRELVVLDVAVVEAAPEPLVHRLGRDVLGIPDGRPAEPSFAAGEPGRALELGGALFVVTGRGLLELRALKPAGKAAMSAAEWLRGARLGSEERFG